ncbi:MAG TPA: hypothetical protein PLF26_01575 [Blastocatellia bacterium]|nr:hypothetical protein [Blastocatellia bacterium]
MHRLLGLVMLLTFGHAVAVHLLHGQRVQLAARDASAVVRIDSADTSHGTAPSHESCSSCQLQHGFLFEQAAPTAVLVVPVAEPEVPIARLAAVLCGVQNLPPGRGPPSRL